MKKIRLALFMLGLALFAGLVLKLGPRQIWHQATMLKWNLAFVIAVYFLVYLPDTLGWKYAFSEKSKQPGLGGLFSIRLMGEVINYLTPTASLGGEPFKAHMIKERYSVPLTEGLASVVVAKTTLVISHIIFLSAGLSVALAVFDLAPALRNGIFGMLVLGVVCVSIFFVWQSRGLFSPFVTMLKRLKLAPHYLSLKEEKIKELDRNIASFYREEKKRFWLSLSFHLAGWFAGILEVYIILKFLGLDCGLAKAFVIESLSSFVRLATFFIPANAGSHEAGNVAIFLSLGLDGVSGMAMSIIRRMRELAWGIAGMALLWQKRG